uniref:Uncharacterized protein n=1 Tax=Avena sativa TaxID=4498 RepID=A0ACD5TSK2_AVESA
MQPLAAILAAALLLAAAAIASGACPPAIINATCSSLSYSGYPGYNYCVSVLSSSGPSASIDGRGLAVIAANTTAHNVTATVGLIDDLLDTLPKCSGLYRRQMADKVASALADLVAGHEPTDSTYSLYMDAHDLGPVNCFIALTETYPGPGFPRPSDPLAQEDQANMDLVTFAMNVAKLIPNKSSSGSPDPPAAIINATCSSLSYGGYPGYSYCVDVLSPGLASGARDTRDLAIVATNAIIRNITSTASLIDGLVSDAAQCKVSYGDRMGKTVASAIGDLVTGRALAGAASKLDGASRHTTECDLVMSKRRGVEKNVLHEDNAENLVSAQFASNVAAMYAANKLI